jgi:iron(III) transport system substrate-binding protein
VTVKAERLNPHSSRTAPEPSPPALSLQGEGEGEGGPETLGPASRIIQVRLVGAALACATAVVAVAVLGGAPPGLAADADLSRLIEAAKAEGEVHYIDAVVHPKTQTLLDRAFHRKYGLPDSFKFTHTLQGTGQVVASVQQEIKAGQHSIDVVWVGAPSFFKAAAKAGDFLPYVSPEWRHYEAHVKRLALEADPPNWITPAAYAFVPVWNRKCPGFANVRIASWKDLLNPAFRGKMMISDVRRSFTFAATWVGVEAAMGKDYFPKFVEIAQPAIVYRTEESLQKVISCEYPIQNWQSPGRVYERAREDPSLDLGVAWPQEGVVVLGVPMAILKGSRRPNAARLLVDFLLSEEGMRLYLDAELRFSLREGMALPEAGKRYMPEIDQVKALPMNWAALTLQEVRKAQDDFRRVLKAD